MTDEDEVPEETEHTCGGVFGESQRFSMWFLPAMISNLLANLCRTGASVFASFANFWDEANMAFGAHGFYSQSKSVDVGVVDSFREQLNVL